MFIGASLRVNECISESLCWTNTVVATWTIQRSLSLCGGASETSWARLAHTRGFHVGIEVDWTWPLPCCARGDASITEHAHWAEPHCDVVTVARMDSTTIAEVASRACILSAVSWVSCEVVGQAPNWTVEVLRAVIALVVLSWSFLIHVRAWLAISRHRCS